MELLTRNNFEGWMQKLMERLDRQDELLLAMKAEGKQPTITESIRLFDNQDLCMLLQISKRTLQRYRSVGALPYKTLGKKTYYSEEDVLTFLSNHIKDFKKDVAAGRNGIIYQTLLYYILSSATLFNQVLLYYIKIMDGKIPYRFITLMFSGAIRMPTRSPSSQTSLVSTKMSSSQSVNTVR